MYAVIVLTIHMIAISTVSFTVSSVSVSDTVCHFVLHRTVCVLAVSVYIQKVFRNARRRFSAPVRDLRSYEIAVRFVVATRVLSEHFRDV